MSKSAVNDSYCRYPRTRSPETSFDVAGVSLEQKLAHEFVNGFNYEIMATFKCNDIQVLFGGRDTADRIHYCTKYVTKQQKRLDSAVVMALASFQRRQEREARDEGASDAQAVDGVTKARKRVASMHHDEPKGGGWAAGGPAVSFLNGYVFRPNQLADVGIYEFAMIYFRKKGKSTRSTRLAFQSGHPLHRTHSLDNHYREVVPVIQGFRLPYVTSRSSESVRYKHAVLSLVLFKPFRTLSDIIGSTADSEHLWLDAYEQWECTRSDFVVKIMSHIDDCGADRAKANADQYSSSGGASSPNAQSDSDADSTSDDCDSLFSGCDTIDGEEDDDPPKSDNFAEPWELHKADPSALLDSTILDPATFPTPAKPDSRVTGILRVFDAHHMLEGNASCTVSRKQAIAPAEFPSVSNMRAWVQTSSTDCQLQRCVQPESDTRDADVVELVNDTLLDEQTSSWNSPHTPPVPPGNAGGKFATITAVSQHFTLNEKQHHAFRLIGNALLTRWRKVEVMSYVEGDLDDDLRQDQLLLVLGGEGGTGKSRVLDAVQKLCDSWNRPGCLIKAALTGKAATLICGGTLASLLLQLKKKRREAALYLDILVIDEVSMMKKHELAKLDKYLRIAKKVVHLPFGGVHVVLVGDFLQLPPVGGPPLYKNPSESRDPAADDFTGFKLWRLFDHVILLDDCVRFRADPEWGRGCQLARKGLWFPEFVDLINSRVTSAANASKTWIPGDPVPSLITPDNTTRLAINNLFVATAAKLLPKGEYPVRVGANFGGKLDKLGSSEVRNVMTFPDTKFGGMAPYLDQIVGMPVQITQNIRAAKMVSNGTLGTLEQIINKQGTEFCYVRDCVEDVTVKVPSVTPLALIVRTRRGAMATAKQGCVDSDLFPVFPDARLYGESHISLAPSPAGNPRTLSVRIEQFPLVCAVSSIVYKVQGETLAKMVVTEWRSENRVSNKPEQPYLLVSRVASRLAFQILCPLTDEITTWARPSKEALDGEDRLQQLSTVTLQTLIGRAYSGF